MSQDPIRTRHARNCQPGILALVLLAAGVAPLHANAAMPPAAKTMQEVLDASSASDWRALDPARTLYLELDAGRVVIELAPAFAPLHVANILTLVRAHYFDGLSINRVQDNFVTQWGDAAAGTEEARSLGKARSTLAPEFTRSSKDLPFTPLPDGDVYAPEVGFSAGFPVARDVRSDTAWLAHCYGMLGVGRDNSPQSGSGAELYVVIGQAPRQLDRNIALVGRVVAGMEWLAALPRGTGPLGFYENAEQRTRIESVRVAADVPIDERSELELLRTDTPTFTALVESRRNRRDDWYLAPAGRIGRCNVPLPVRKRAARTNP
jgi:peptidylprolyl isomerase